MHRRSRRILEIHLEQSEKMDNNSCNWGIYSSTLKNIFPSSATTNSHQSSLLLNSSCAKKISLAYSLKRSEDDAPLACRNLTKKNPKPDAILCYFASWVYFEVGRRLIIEYVQNKKPLPCNSVTGNIERQIAALIIFLEWRVRPHLPHPYGRSLPGVGKNRTNSLQTVQQALWDDAETLKAYHLTPKWLKKYKFNAFSTYGDSERPILNCLISFMEQKASEQWNIFIKTSHRGGILYQEQYASYRAQLRKKLENADGKPTPLTHRFIPPPLVSDEKERRPTDYGPYAHSNNHLIISGEFLSGKTTIMRMIALLQTPDVAVIWLSASTLGRLNGATIEDVFSEALQELMGPLSEEKLSKWRDMLKLAQRRVFILDATLTPSQKLIHLLAGFGRVIIGVQDAFELPKSFAGLQWETLKLDEWSTPLLRRLLRKEASQFVDALPDTLETQIRAGLPSLPGWILALHQVQIQDSTSLFHVIQNILKTKFEQNPPPPKYQITLRRIAWRMFRLQGPCPPPEGAQSRTRCEMVLKWGQNVGLIVQGKEGAAPHFRFVHPLVQQFLVAEFMVRSLSPQDWNAQKENDRLPEYHNNEHIDRSWRYLYRRISDRRHEDSKVLNFVIHLLYQENRWRDIFELLNVVYERTSPLFQAENFRDWLLLGETSGAVGLIRRLILEMGWHQPESDCSRLIEFWPHREALPEEAFNDCMKFQELYHICSELVIQRIIQLLPKLHISPLSERIYHDLRYVGRQLWKLEPLTSFDAERIARALISYPSRIHNDAIDFIFSPSVNQALEKLLVHKQSFADKRGLPDIIFGLSRRRVLSALGIIMISQANHVEDRHKLHLLSYKGDEDAAHMLSVMWKAPFLHLMPLDFSQVTKVWQGDWMLLFPLVYDQYRRFRFQQPSLWRVYARNFLSDADSSQVSEFLLSATLFNMPLDLLYEIIGTISIAPPSLELALTLIDLLHHIRQPDKYNWKIRQRLERLIELLLYLNDENLLSSLSIQEVLYILETQNISDWDSVHIAELVLLSHVTEPAVQAFSLQWLSQKQPRLGRLAAAILLLDCRKRLDNFYPSLTATNEEVIQYVIQKRLERCSSRLIEVNSLRNP